VSDAPAPIVRTRAVSIFANQFGELFDDEVRAPTGQSGRYLRWRWSEPGVVVVGRSDKGLLFVPTFRYPVQLATLEFPRGGRHGGEDTESAARRELLEECGYLADQATSLGVLFADTGLIETGITVVETIISDLRPPRRKKEREHFESFAHPTWVPEEQIDDRLRSGSLQCAITIGAYALWVAHRR
jgi:8-oxo-dGTP pyrophosphatase MutT (NUDIX family)